jgi:hypothetical protein
LTCRGMIGMEVAVEEEEALHGTGSNPAQAPPSAASGIRMSRYDHPPVAARLGNDFTPRR